MRIFLDLPMTAMPRGFSFVKGQRHAVIMAKAEYELVEGELVLGSAELEDAAKLTLEADDPAGEPDVALVKSSEQAPTKPKADVLLFGTAYAPGGAEAAGVRTLLRVSRSSGEAVIEKEIDVVGDRVWMSDGTRGDILPFTSMPMTWERAFGGPGDKLNPAGVGRRGDPLPNLERPDRPVESRDAKIEPTCYAAVNPAWKPRCDKLGSYGADYVEKYWPWMPGDFDWSHFNTAPDDQQVEGFLVGDETIEMRHLVEGHETFRTKLAGDRLRAFVLIRERDGSETFREVELVIDTLTIMPDEKRVSVVWRGQTEARSLKLLEFEHLMLVREKLDDADRGPAFFRERLQNFMDHPYEAMLSPEALDETKAALAAAEDAKKQAETAQAEAEAKRAEADKRIDEVLAEAKEKGVDIEDPRTKPKEVPASRYDMVNDSIAAIDRAIDAMETRDAEAFAETIAETRRKRDELQAQRGTLKAEFQRPTPAELEEAARSGTPMHNRDLSYVDASGASLAGLDLTGGFLLETVFRDAHLGGAVFTDAIVLQTSFAGANLAGADLARVAAAESDFRGADLSGAQLEGTVFAESPVDGCRMSGAKVTSAVLQEANLAGCDLSGANGERAVFFGADLTGAVLDDASLTTTVFQNAVLEDASLFRADLRNSLLGGVRASRACLVAADLRKASFILDADLTDADLRLINGPEASFQGATLTDAWFGGAELTRSVFAESKLIGTEMVCVNAPMSDFADAFIHDADFTHSNLFRSIFDRSEMLRLHLEGASLFQSGFCESEIDTVWLADTNLKRTLLEDTPR